MAWYYILFFITFGFFILKTLISWIFGDIDVDFDEDGDVDFDISSLFSFKGLLHFLMGFSAYISFVAKMHEMSGSTYNLTVSSYIMASIIGVLFCIAMFCVYALMIKLDHKPDDENYNNHKCSILISNGPISEFEYSYTVLVSTVSGTQKINVLSKNKNLKIGSEHTIFTNEQGIYYI